MRACMRCGSEDLEGGPTAQCARCGNVGPAAEFGDRRALADFQQARAALYKGAPLEAPLRRSTFSRGIAAMVGFVFVLGGAMAFFAAVAGGPDALPLLATGTFGLLLGVPFIALARRR